MDKDSKDFLYKLLAVPGPTGDEARVQALLAERLGPLADEVGSDVHGNLYLTLNPDAKRRVMLAGHCDQVGFLVTEIGSDGYLYVEPLGGLDESVVPGSRVTVHTRDGPLQGVVGKTAVHLQAPQQMQQVTPLKELWIDVGAEDRSDAERRVRLGDYATYTPGVTELLNGLVASPGLDDRAGVFVMAEVFRRCSAERPDVGLVAASTVQEEIGMRGATTASISVRPEVAISVDLTNASDDPGRKRGMVPCLLGRGPVIPSGPGTNPVVSRLLAECARRRDIPHQLAPGGSLAGNDSKAMQVAGGAAAAAGVGIPNRNMHTQVEVCHLGDLERTVELLVEFLRSIDDETDFRPFRI